jgi:predicted NBD/HSP70 family sugar kinase
MTNHSLLLGVDLGGSKIEAALLNGQQQFVERQRCVTPKGSYEQILSAVCDLCDQVEASIRQKGMLTDGRLPIGIGTPGSPSPTSGLMRNCNSTLLNGRTFKEDLERASNRDVRMANDADCLALSELADGAAAGSNCLFAVILGTGVGGGVCIRGSLLQGPNGISGEWGHNRLPLERVAKLPRALKGSRPCYCGRSDCIETWLSGPGLALSHEQLHGQPVDVSALTDSLPDAAHQETLDVYCKLLATALASVVNLLDPEVIVFGGGLSNIPMLYSTLPALLGREIFSDVCNTRLLPAMHGDSSGVRGAARLWASA